MFTKTNYTDPQGVTHAEAIFRILNATVNSDSNKSFNANLNDTTTASQPEDLNESVNLNYTAVYWPTQASYDASEPHYTLLNAERNTYFRANIIGNADYVGLSAEASAEMHVQTVL